MSVERFRVDGKVALVTGAAQGIGRAIAEVLGEAGAHLIVSDRQAEKLAAVAKALEESGCKVVGVPPDVADAGQVEGMVREGLKAFGAIDILVNNAGGSGDVGVIEIEDVSEELWDTVVTLAGLGLQRRLTPPVDLSARRVNAGELVSSVVAWSVDSLVLTTFDDNFRNNPPSRVRYAYDVADRPTRVEDGLSSRVDLGYDLCSNVIRLTETERSDDGRRRRT